MKQLVVCPHDFHLHYRDIIAHGELVLMDEIVPYALIEREDLKFDPEKNPDKVLVRKLAFSCNYRDVSLIKTVHQTIKNKKDLTYFVIGSEFSGVVVNIGVNVTKVKVGDRVLCDAFYPYVPGKHAPQGLPTNHASSELEIIHELKLAIMPDNMPFSIGGAFPVGAQTTYSMIEKLNINDGERILITGIKSNTSLFALNALKDKNVELSGLARGNVDEDFFKNLGIKNIFYVPDDCESLLDNTKIMDYIKLNGKFDCVIDPFSDSYLFMLLDFINVGGRYITCGLSNQTAYKPTTVNLAAQLSKVINGNITIIGNCLGSTENLNKALNDFASNRYDVIIDNVISNDIHYFMERSFVSKEKLGKVVFNYAAPPVE